MSKKTSPEKKAEHKARKQANKASQEAQKQAYLAQCQHPFCTNPWTEEYDGMRVCEQHTPRGIIEGRIAARQARRKAQMLLGASIGGRI